MSLLSTCRSRDFRPKRLNLKPYTLNLKRLALNLEPKFRSGNLKLKVHALGFA